MKISKVIFVLVLSLMGSAVLAQNTPEFEKAIKITLPVSYTVKQREGQIFRRTGFNLNMPTPSLLLKKENGDWHEWELSHIGIHTNGIGEKDTTPDQNWINGGEVNRFNLGGRYQYTFSFGKEEGRLHSFLGIFSSLGFRGDVDLPYTSEEFWAESWSAYAYVGIAPGMRWRVKGKVFADIALVFPLLKYDYLYTDVGDPNLTFDEQRTSTSNFNVGVDGVVMRLGLGIDL